MNREPLRRRLIVQRRIWGSWKIDDMFSIGLSVLEKGDWIGVLGEEAPRREHIGVKHASTKKRGDSTKSIDSSAIQSLPGQKTIYMQEGGRVRPLSLYNQTPPSTPSSNSYLEMDISHPFGRTKAMRLMDLISVTMCNLMRMYGPCIKPR